MLSEVVVAAEQQRQCLGRQMVQALLASQAGATAEQIFLMTTNSGFYSLLGFTAHHDQHLPVLHRRG